MKKNRIRILHVNDQKKYGGGENQTFLLIKELLLEIAAKEDKEVISSLKISISTALC